MIALPFSFPGIPHVRCAFQTRLGGVSAGPYQGGNISFDVGDDAANVRSNRSELLRALELDRCSELKQVHGDAMVFDPEPGTGWGHGTVEADGQACARPGIGLVIKTADCQPLLLAHAGGRCVAGLHVGWRGNRIGFIGSAVQKICELYGVEARDLKAVRGPSLGPGAAEFVHFDREWGGEFREWFDEQTRCMDLWRLTRDQLVQAGLREQNIFSLDLCTFSLPEWFFSYRRKKQSGRQAAIIWMDR